MSQRVSGAAPAPRDDALDALRGLAVLGMVFSGSIGFGGALPAWMYHAQLPPPAHKLVPTLAGLSWVDLVFPMFLFALGVAIPLSLRGLSLAQQLKTTLRRFVLLLYFAFFTQQFKAWYHGDDASAQALALGAFVLLGLQLVRRVPVPIQAAAWGLALLLWVFVGFEPRRSDIILLVLAWMALVGGLLWIATQRQPQARWLAPLAVLALMLAPPEAWTRALTATPAPWFYQFAFLKYLLIVVPGLWVGDCLIRSAPEPAGSVSRRLALLAASLVLLNLVLLFARETAWNAGLSLALLALGWPLAQRAGARSAQLWSLATGLLVLGLLMEPLQGGIRKDPSTFSYQVLGAGLSLLLMLALPALPQRLLRGLAIHGRNPLLAYVAGALLLTPLLKLMGLYPAWAGLNGTAPLALLKGVLFTGLVVAVVLGAQRRGWIWRA